MSLINCVCAFPIPTLALLSMMHTGVSKHWTGFSTGMWDWNVGLDYQTGLWDWNSGVSAPKLMLAGTDNGVF